MPVVDTAANVTVWFVLSPPFDTPTWRPVGTRSASGSTHMREELNCSSSGSCLAEVVELPILRHRSSQRSLEVSLGCLVAGQPRISYGEQSD